MTKIPLVMLCLQSGGELTPKAARAFVDDCAKRQRRPRYTVECYECETSTPASANLQAVEVAIECARWGLMVNPKAAIGLGFAWGKRIVQVHSVTAISPIVTAALLLRNDTGNPFILEVTRSQGEFISKHLLKACEAEGLRRFRDGHIMAHYAAKAKQSA